MRSRLFTLSLLLVVCSPALLASEVLSFSKAYELALEHANNIRASVYSAEAEKEKINQEKAALYPQINFSSFYKKGEMEQNPAKNMIRQGLFNYTLSAHQSIYDAEIYSRIDLQKSRSKHQEIRTELQKKELAQELFGSYLDLLKSRNRISLLEAYLEYNQTRVKELEYRFDMNLANKMDLLEMQVERDVAKIELQKERKLFNVYSLKFQNLIGDTKYKLPEVRSRESVEETISLMEGKIIAKESVEESLYVKQAEAALMVSASELENAKDGHMPKVSFDASYSIFDTDTPTIDAPFNFTRYVMLNVNLPIFSGGATESRIDSSKLLYQAALEELHSTKKEIRVMYEEYMARFFASMESVSMYNNAYSSAELYVDAIEQGYEHGLKSVTDLNDAKHKLYEVRFKYIENIYELVHSYVGACIVTDNFEDISLLDQLIELE